MDELGERAATRPWRLLRLAKDQRGQCPALVLSCSSWRRPDERNGDQAIVRLAGGRTSFVGRLLLRAAVPAKRRRDPRVRSGDEAELLGRPPLTTTLPAAG
jgi:hypothetical protein